ncbi:MAG: flagellin [Microbacteriaceae bacterium]|jgi:flagellin|nr:flagellin [Microbacteriaceae bacterium]
MAMTINTNLGALQVTNALSQNQAALQSSMQKLATGSRINTAADDPAGLAISQALQSQIGGMTQASANTADGISLIQTASGALTQVSSILQNIRNLVVQSGNDTQSSTSLADIGTAVTALVSQLNKIGASTNFNGVNLLDGATNAPTPGQVTFQVGANGTANDQVTVDLTGANVVAVGSALAGLGFGSANVSASLTTLDTQIQNVATAQATLGANQNVLQAQAQSLSVNSENLTAANSQISDTNMASEMAKFTKDNVLMQAGAAMLSQANQQSQLVLKLLQ